MSSTDPKATSGNIYRTARQPLFEEDERLVAEKAWWFRVSARYSLDHRCEERERERAEAVPDRRDNPSFQRNPVEKRVAAVEPKRQLTDEDMLAQPNRGHFKLVGVFRKPIAGESGEGDKMVRAVCTGGHCDGTRSNFRYADWVSRRTERKCCVRCKAILVREEKLAEKRATTHPTHGAYAFVCFEADGRRGKLAVRGRCTGPLCGGLHERVFAWSSWQHDQEGRGGCLKCTAPARTKLAGVRANYGSMANLKAAAAEMRAEEARPQSAKEWLEQWDQRGRKDWRAA